MQPLFRIGQLYITPGAQAAYEEAQRSPADHLARHVTGDWGDVDPHDAAENARSVEAGYRILSAYPLTETTRVWVITEHDRSATTILLPDEY